MTVNFPIVEFKEGAARFMVPDPKAFKKAPVFYNPKMSVNRDLAILFLKTYQREVGRRLRVCEPMTGCGVRGLRFALEVCGMDEVIINDLSEGAYELAKLNVEINGLQDLISVRNEDASQLLSRYCVPRQRLDYVDLDPFGSPSPFLDCSLRAVRSGGALALTATDTAPLSGLHVKACMRKYLGRPLRVEYGKEIAVRLLVGVTVLSAARHDLGVKPMLSYGANHYVRLYVTLSRGAKEADRCLDQMGYIIHCRRCLHREFIVGLDQIPPNRCPNCGSFTEFSGPMWLGKLVEAGFCAEMLKYVEESTLERSRDVAKLLGMLKAEADASPTYYVSDEIGRRLRVSLPPIEKILLELWSRGFYSTRTHFHSNGFKTDAPPEVVLDVVRNLQRRGEV
ncbi:MAG: tRNA (guanine(10)-N(2))-dimethyltransferase [Candidatus Bathyarchaeia archaeon]